MTLEQIFELWQIDSQIDSTNLSSASLDIPKIHNKYLKMFSEERLKLKKFEQDGKALYRIKSEYYAGTLDHETLTEKGWEPNPLKILRSDIPTFLEGDNDIIAHNLKVAVQKEKVETLESIIRSLNNRGFLIKNAIDWQRFQNGG